MRRKCGDRCAISCGNEFLVPPGLQRQFIVADRVGPALRRCEVRQLNARQLRNAPPLRRQDAAVAVIGAE
jgi:hypothetical protein